MYVLWELSENNVYKAQKATEVRLFQFNKMNES